MKEEIEILRKHKEFFLNYKKTFIKTFFLTCSELNHDITTNEKVEIITANLYDNFFPFEIKEKDDLGIASNLCSIIDKVIDVKEILSINLFVMAKDFVNYLSPKENNIIYLKSLINIIEDYVDIVEECVGIFNRTYYDDNKETDTKDVIVRDKSEVYESIIEGFEFLKINKKEVRLLNFFRGVPVSHNASIFSVSKDRVIFNIHKYQTVALEEENHTAIKSEIFPNVLMANLVTLDESKTKAIFTDFAYLDSSPEKRESIRVQPKGTIEVTVCSEDGKVKGFLVDLSVEAIAVCVASLGNLKQKSDVDIHLKLPNITQNTFTEIKLFGTVYRILGSGDHHHKLVAMIHPDAYNKPLIKEYITIRQIEIVQIMKFFT